MAALADFDERGIPVEMHSFLRLSSSSREDDYQEDIVMLESPDSGYRSPPQNYFPMAGPSHIVLYTGSIGADEPFLEIVEQPVEKFRFRYKSEMAGTHGSLTGVNSDRSRKQTYPTVVLHNYKGPATIRCSLYQHNCYEDDKPHAHRLVKKFGNDEIDDPHEIDVDESCEYKACFQHMGIIHTAKKYIVSELMKKKTNLKKEEIKRKEGKDRTLTKKEAFELESSANSESKSINLNVVCLRFDAFKTTSNGALERICMPVYSHSINNLKSALTGELKIVRMSRCSSSCKGGAEVFLLVEKVTKKNINVRFFEEDDNGIEIWHSYGKFSEVDVHHQYAIVLKTPAYKNLNIDHNVKVFIELVRKTDRSRSDPKEFVYTPCSSFRTGVKRPRYDHNSSASSFSSVSSGLSAMQIPATVSALSIEKQSLSGIELNSKEHLQLGTDELEKLYQEVLLTTDSPTKRMFRDRLDLDRNRMDMGMMSESEYSYCVTVYKQLYALRQTKPDESTAAEMLHDYFVKQAADMPTRNNPLHIIAYNYKESFAKYLDFFLKEINALKRADILNATNQNDETPLHIAVNLNAKEAVEMLVEATANINCQDGDGNTTLHLAVKNNNADILSVLLRNNKTAVVNEENNDGDTPLNIAIRNGNYMCFILLCVNGADINKSHKKDGFTPLRMAVDKSDLRMVKFLLGRSDIDVVKPDFNDIMPINAAEILKNTQGSQAKEVYLVLEEFMNRSGLVKTEIPIKEELESEDEDDESEPMHVEVKTEDAEEIKRMYEEVKGNLNFEDLYSVLDYSGGWQNLADLLDLKHLWQETVLFENEPTKTLFDLALTKGESLFQIREFLENLDEVEAVKIMDDVVYKHTHPVVSA